MQDPNEPTTLPDLRPSQAAQDTAPSPPESGCAVFESAREAACADPVLGRLWLNLFDDADI